MKKIVITGASGFLGNHIVKKASESNEVVAIIRRNSARKDTIMANDNVSIIELDMHEYNCLGEMVKNADCFIHLAWDGIRGAARMDEEIQKKNYLYGVAAVQSMIDSGCREIVLVGSQAEYGEVEGLIDEDMKCYPTTHYGKYKLRVFNEVNRICMEKGISCKEARVFSLYGEGDTKESLISYLFENMRCDKKCDLSACVQKWDYLYVEDAADAILSLCTTACENGVYNIASGDIRVLKEYVEELKVILESKSELNYAGELSNNTNAVSIEPSIKKITEQTGWKRKFSFEDGIKKMNK